MKRYNDFCGWYFKISSGDESFAFIPAIHTSCGRQNGSVQFIGASENRYVPFPADACRVERKNPGAVIGENIFSPDGMHIHLNANGFPINGSLRFGPPAQLSYDIMGPFGLVPFLECRHSVFSMRHEVNGTLQIGERLYRFDNGAGYIEGDRGRSFPRKYLWTQCLFERGSLMLAVAEIPLGAMRFNGVIGIVWLDGAEYRIATYLNAKILKIGKNEVVIRQGDLTLTAVMLDAPSAALCAPDRGAMTRTIRENIVCRARYELRRNHRILLALESSQASFEFEYP